MESSLVAILNSLQYYLCAALPHAESPKACPFGGKTFCQTSSFAATHYQEEDGHTRNPDLTEVELGSAGLEEPVASALRAGLRKDRLGVSCNQGHHKASRETAR